MLSQHNRDKTIPIAIVVIAALIVGAVSLVLLAPQSNRSASSSSSTTGTSYATCAVNFMGNGTFLQIISESTQQPLTGVSLHVSPVANGDCYVAQNPATYNTNSSGWVSLGALPGGAHFLVSLEYAGTSYNFSIPQQSLDVSYATLRLPSGNLSVTLCLTLDTPPSFEPYNQTGIVSTTTGVK